MIITRFVAALAVGIAGAAALPATALATPGPATPGAAVPVIRTCEGLRAVKPATIPLTCQDGQAKVAVLTDVVWTEWTAQDAIGYGKVRETVCKPDCLSGKVTVRNVGITAHTPVGKGPAKHFSVVTYGASGAWGNNFQDAQLP